MPRIAVGQLGGTRPQAWRETLDNVERSIACAGALNSQLLVLPECVWPAYHLGSREAYAELRRAGLPPPECFLERVEIAAQRAATAVCVGHVRECDDGRLCNSATYFDPDGRRLATIDKSFLWDFDWQLFEPGTRVAAFDCALGRVGVLICADLRLPEIPAALAADGAQLLVQPTAWVNGGSSARPYNIQADFLMRVRAFEHAAPVASASKWGSERGVEFVGLSRIADADGRVVAELGGCGDGLTIADVALPPSRRSELALAGPALTPSALPEFVNVTIGADGRARIDPNHAVADIDARETLKFVAVRRLAAAGALVLRVRGDAPLDVLRARAAENRIFVVQEASDGAWLFDPRGAAHAIVGERRLELSAARDKQVAPGSHVFDRRPAALIADA